MAMTANEKEVEDSFEFAYDKMQYSDRKLRLVIKEAQPRPLVKEEPMECSRLGDEVAVASPRRPLKRRRDASPVPACLVVSDEASSERDPPTGGSCDVTTEFVDIQVNSVLLAKGSMYFRRIFDGESFKESCEKVIHVHLIPEDKEPFLQLVKFIYSGKLEESSFESLCPVWMLAQRFLAESCLEFCVKKIKVIPLTLYRACYFLDLASVVDQRGEVKDLIDRSLVFLTDHFTPTTVMNSENPTRWSNMEDFKALSSSTLELLLNSDKLRAVHEESVFYLVRAWVKANCMGSEEEKNAWEKYGPLVRWPSIEIPRLRVLMNVQEARYIKDMLEEALLYRVSNDDEKKLMMSDVRSNFTRFRRRYLHAVPVNYVSMEEPLKYAIVCFNVSSQMWSSLISQLPSEGLVCSERFVVGGHSFIWLLQCHRAERKKKLTTSLVLMTSPVAALRIDINVSIWDPRTISFTQRYKGVHTLKKETGERIAMCLDCLGQYVDEIQAEKNGLRFLYKDAIWFRAEVQVEKL